LGTAFHAQGSFDTVHNKTKMVHGRSHKLPTTIIAEQALVGPSRTDSDFVQKSCLKNARLQPLTLLLHLAFNFPASTSSCLASTAEAESPDLTNEMSSITNVATLSSLRPHSGAQVSKTRSVSNAAIKTTLLNGKLMQNATLMLMRSRETHKE
jgi:hypothetical protein